MKRSFHLEIPFETMEAIVDNFEPQEGVDLLIGSFKQAILDYIMSIIEEGGDIEDETCLSRSEDRLLC